MLSAAMEWSSALTPHQKQIRKQLLDDNNQMSTGHNVKIADHLIDNLHKKLKQLELFFTFFTFACNCLVTLLSHSTTTSCTPFFWGEFLTPPSMATPYVPLSLLYTHTKTHRYPKLNWSWAPLIKVTLFFPVSCPIISYSLVQYNLIQLQKLPVLNHNCIISTTQQRNDFFFFFFYILHYSTSLGILSTETQKYIPPAVLWHNIQEHSALTQNHIISAPRQSFVHHTIASTWPQKSMGLKQTDSTSHWR